MRIVGHEVALEDGSELVQNVSLIWNIKTESMSSGTILILLENDAPQSMQQTKYIHMRKKHVGSQRPAGSCKQLAADSLSYLEFHRLLWFF